MKQHASMENKEEKLHGRRNRMRKIADSAEETEG